MIKLVRSIFSVIVAAILIVFSLGNRQTASIIWSPIHQSAELPVYLLLLIALLIGFIIGGIMVWLNYIPIKRLNKKQNKKIINLEKKLESSISHSVTNQMKPLLEHNGLQEDGK
jgi:uncharacterized membrane protein YciS (DUF1049 family)